MRFWPFILFLLLVSCTDSNKEHLRDAVVSVEGYTLTYGDLQKVIPEGISPEDSIALANDYIQAWATDILLYQNAQRNIRNQSEIDKMVEEYRKSLIINSYQQRLMQERLQAPTVDEVRSFYLEHGKEFILNDYIVKGILIKIPNTAPKQDQSRKQMRTIDLTSIEFIQTDSVHYAVSYDYFLDNCVYFSDLNKRVSLP